MSDIKPVEVVIPVSAEQVLQIMKAFEDFKKKVLRDTDTVKIEDKLYVKKSGWSKYALACQISTECKEERVDEDGKYHFVYRAIHLPSGRYADAVGSASKREIAGKRKVKEDQVSEHDARALAQTRAFNRAISNLVGGGEISAEEIDEEEEKPSKPAKPVGRLLSVDDVAQVLMDNSIDPYYFSIRLVSDDLIEVMQKDWLQPDVWNTTNNVLHGLNGEYIPSRERGKFSSWKIPRHGSSTTND
jgi:hypothetical protein